MAYPSRITWTDKQKRFVDEYIKDSNGTQAAIRAGFAPRAASRTASDLLKNPDVRAAVDARMNKIAEKVDITAEKVLKDIEDIRTSASTANDYGAALRASELQGKYLKMFTDKVQQEMDMHITVVTGVPDREV